MTTLKGKNLVQFRTHSVILINNDDQVLFYERTMEGETSEESWTETRHEFNLEPAIAL